MVTQLVLVVVGAILVVVGAVDAYRGRMREQPPGSGLYSVPTGSLRALVVALLGAAVSVTGGLVALVSQ